MARCRVCHRTLTNADHIAAGIGPECAKKAARHEAASGTAYPTDRYARIVRGCERLAELMTEARRYVVWAEAEGTTAEMADAAWKSGLIRHWYERWTRMERETRGRLAAPQFRQAA